MTSNTSGAAPVAVFGPLRGGTTMIRLMLHGHPELSAPGESDFLLDHLQRAGGTVAYDRDGLAAGRIYQDSPVRIDAGLDGQAALRDMVAQVGRAGGGRPVLMLHRHLSLCADLLPGLKVIRLLRDPRDVAQSSIGMGWAGNLYYGLDPWLQTERDWRRFAETHPDVPKHVVRYEDLVAEPERELGAICAFLGIPYDAGMLAYPSHTTYDAPDPKFSFQWKKRFSERDIRLVETRAGAVWEGCGYAPSGLPPLSLGAVERQRLRLQNRAAIWRHLFRRHGIVAPVARGLGRRLGWRRLEFAAAARIARIDRRHLK